MRLFADDALALLLRAHEQDLVALADAVLDDLLGLLHAVEGLREVDDVDPVAAHEDERPHLGIPAVGLMTEVSPGFQELSHFGNCHDVLPPLCRFCLRGHQPAAGRGANAPADPRAGPTACVITPPAPPAS